MVKEPLSFAPFTYDCQPVHTSLTIIKFNSQLSHTVSNNDESAYNNVVKNLTNWCSTNNLLNSKKTKEIVVDFRCPGGRLLLVLP